MRSSQTTGRSNNRRWPRHLDSPNLAQSSKRIRHWGVTSLPVASRIHNGRRYWKNATNMQELSPQAPSHILKGGHIIFRSILQAPDILYACSISQLQNSKNGKRNYSQQFSPNVASTGTQAGISASVLPSTMVEASPHLAPSKVLASYNSS